jgi:glycosyltransferase involved in cell wall biosynthesis
MAKVSIVSCTYRSFKDTKEFVESVYSMTTEPFEFIMAVNGRVEIELAQYLTEQERLGKMRLVWNPSNIGVRAFNQVMRLAKSDYVFRCDSDILIQDPYWTKRMRETLHAAQMKMGDVAAVGTANTGGYRIQRTPELVETDMIMSNCMLIHAPTADKIAKKLAAELPRMTQYVSERLKGGEFYEGEHEDLKATIEYARLHAPWWDLQFGGPTESLGYGSDDIWWSLLARWAGLKLVTSAAKVVHKDASARPDYKEERHRLVARGFQYLRTSLSLIMDVWSAEQWMELPNKLPVLVEYRKSGELLTT